MNSKPSWYWPFEMGLVFAVGLSSVWLIFYAATGSGFWPIWRTALQTQLSLHRPYWPWLALHLNDFFMFSGWPLALLAIVAAWRALRGIRSRGVPTDADMMILSFALAVLILDLSGTMQGESGRLLLFLSPWLLLTAARGLREDPRAGAAITVTQAILMIAMVLCLGVLAPEFKAHAAPVPPPVKYAASNPTVHPSGATFGGEARLVSYAGKVDTQLDTQGQAQPFIYLWLTWDAASYVNVPYSYEIEPITGSRFDASAATTVAPFGDAYPSTCWKPADGLITDRIKVPLSVSDAGKRWAELSLVDAGTGHAADVLLPDGSHSSSVRLGPFQEAAP